MSRDLSKNHGLTSVATNTFQPVDARLAEHIALPLDGHDRRRYIGWKTEGRHVVLGNKMSETTTSHSSRPARPIAASIGFSGSMIAMGLGAASTDFGEFVITIGVCGAALFAPILVREIVGSIHPAKIIQYLLPDAG